MRDLLDVVDDGEELPLGVHLASAAEGEAPHALVLQVGEDGFDSWHVAAALRDYQTSNACVRWARACERATWVPLHGA